MAVTGKDPKKPKLTLATKPAILSGALCASLNSAADPDASPPRVNPIDVDITSFVDGFTAEDLDTELGQLPSARRKGFLSSKKSEEGLRDAVFTELLCRGGVKFPPRSLKNNRSTDPINKLIPVDEQGFVGKDNRKQYSYQESNLSNVLQASSRFIVPDTDEKQGKMDRLMNGLLVTTTSLPDMVTFQSAQVASDAPAASAATGAAAAPAAMNLFMVRMGEFKNKDNYTKDDASTQCFAYLYSLLYWIRVVHGIPLKSVYGFGFCGRECRDQDNTYSVGLFKLTAPEHLGQLFFPEQYWRKFNTDSDIGIKLLHLYLTRGKLWDMSTAKESRMSERLRGPSLFATPQKFWPRIGQDGQVVQVGEYYLVENGTRATVFKASYKGLLTILKDVQAKTDTIFNIIPKPTNTKEKKYYVKIRTRDTSYHFEQKEFGDIYMKSYFGTGEFWSDFKKTYIAPPIVDKNLLVVIMADRGMMIKDKLASCSEAKMLLGPLKDYMEEMVQAGVFHGDFLPQNFLIDTSGMTDVIRVIDHDEAGTVDVGKRVINEESEESEIWFSAIRYPNPLRCNIKQYTEIQFTASLLLLSPMEELENSCPGLLNAVEDLGTYLLEYERNRKFPMPTGDIEEGAERLIGAVNKKVHSFFLGQ